jgi:hypothetical protein
MPYLPPFNAIRTMLQLGDAGPGTPVAMSYDDFLDMIRSLLSVIEVDEAWYLATYPDVAEAIASGSVPSARHHFLHNGYFEGRLPFAIGVDERWYLQENPGVAEYVRDGRLQSAQQHFDHDGYREGRLPFVL